MPRWLADGIYRARWQYWWPWSTTRPWLPRLFLGSDEYCNSSIGVVGPLVGCLVVFYSPKSMRTERDGICDRCISELEQEATEDD